MKNKYTRNVKKLHLKAWQIIAIIGGVLLFGIATAILVVMYANNIFTENTLCIIGALLIISFIALSSLITYKVLNNG